MIIELSPNEFLTHELHEYMKAAYGLQLTGTPFTISSINEWMRAEKIPDAYGGHKVLAKRTLKAFNKSVYTIEDLDRSILDSLQELEAMRTIDPKAITKSTDKRMQPRTQRTQFAMQLLGSKQQIVKTLEQSTLPDNYKLRGIKPNQIKRSAKRRKKS